MKKNTDLPNLSRRTFLKSGVLAIGVGASSSSVASAQSDQFDGWFDDVDNYEGVVDITDRDEVTIEVGVGQGGVPLGFGPPAVRISPGTKIIWEWTGAGRHNVVEEEGDFTSELTAEDGFTFEQTFEESGVTKYLCSPHVSAGMKGAIVVEDNSPSLYTLLGLGAIVSMIIGILFALPRINSEENKSGEEQKESED